MKIEVFERMLTENDEKYGVKFTIGSQSFKLDYYGDREEVQWMKDMLIQAINNLITKTREETLKELIREYQNNELDGKGYDFYFSIRAKIDELNKLKK